MGDTPDNKTEGGKGIAQKFLERAWSILTSGDTRPLCKYFIGIAPSAEGGFHEGFSCELRHDWGAGKWECSGSHCYSYEPFEPSLLRDGYCCYSSANVYHIMRYIHSARWGVTLCGRLADARAGAEVYGTDKQFQYERLCAYCSGVLYRIEHDDV
jgi:hypothetical protein